MIKQRTLLGQDLDIKTLHLEELLIKQIDSAINNPNPYYTQGDFHQNQSFHENTVPLAFLGSLIDFPKIYKLLEINVKNVLLTKESTFSHQFLKIGDKVLLRTILKNIYEQQAASTPIGFVTLSTFGFKNQDIAFINEKVLAIRGGFLRSKS